MDKTFTKSTNTVLKEYILELEVHKNNPALREPIVEKIRHIWYTPDYDSELIAWFKKESDGGNSSATDYLGDLYYYGWGVKKDFHEAVRLFLISANQENSNAIFNLGYMFSRGLGVDKSQAMAYKLWSMSASMGSVNATRYLKEAIMTNGILKFENILNAV